MSFSGKNLFGGAEIQVSEKFDEMLQIAREARCRELGIDISSLDEMEHS